MKRVMWGLTPVLIARKDQHAGRELRTGLISHVKRVAQHTQVGATGFKLNVGENGKKKEAIRK
jgi:hypothetical protein